MRIRFIENRTVKLIAFVNLCLFLHSCIPQRKIEYLQGQQGKEISYPEPPKPEQTISPGDELYIRVSSFDEVNYNFFSNQGATNINNYANEISVSLISYTVSDSGYLYFPILGNVYVTGMDIKTVTEKLTGLLGEYFNQPTVLVKFVNKKVSVLGEVLRPGQYTYVTADLKLFDALGLAGDITINGNRKDVMIVRVEDNNVKRITVDLTKEKALGSDEFYLQKDDIVYVPPLRSRTWSPESIPWHVILSGITTFILILDYINNNN